MSRLGKVVIDDAIYTRSAPEVKALVDDFLATGKIIKQYTKETHETYILDHPMFEECDNEVTPFEYFINIIRHEPYTRGLNHNREYTLSVKKC